MFFSALLRPETFLGNTFLKPSRYNIMIAFKNYTLCFNVSFNRTIINLFKTHGNVTFAHTPWSVWRVLLKNWTSHTSNANIVRLELWGLAIIRVNSWNRPNRVWGIVFTKICEKIIIRNSSKTIRSSLETENLEFTPNVNISIYFDHVFLAII